jgi:hypothetical protein
MAVDLRSVTLLGKIDDLTSTCTNWQSDNASILTVDNRGLITAHGGTGSSNITVICQGVAGHVTLNIGATSGPPFILPRFRIGATCTDGWISSATGSGACSSHDGVTCWLYSDGTCTNP